MIIETITTSSFVDAFRAAGRQDQFSYSGLRALYDYLEGLSDDLGEPIALDVIALCCDYSEYQSALDCINDCGYSYEPEDLDPEEYGDDIDQVREEMALDWLREHTTVIEHDHGVIIQDF